MNELPDGFVLDRSEAQTAPTGGLPDGFVLDGPKRSVMDKLVGVNGERYQLWPERLARELGSAAAAGPKVLEAVAKGQIEPNSDEAIAGLTQAAMVFSPANPGAVAGLRYGGSTVARPSVSAAQPAGIRAATTANELGAPLPAGVASENTGIQALTQGARQLPYVGQKIDNKLTATSNAASERLASEVSDLSGGVTARADVGETLRKPLAQIISDNKSVIDESFNALRSSINAEAPTAPRNLAEALIEVGRKRIGSGWDNPGAGLDNLVNLVRQRASFNGLQRARTELAETMDFGAAHGGFTLGDKKQIMAAISKDMEAAVTGNVKPGIRPENALSLYKSANETFGWLAGENGQVAELLASKRDTLLSGRIIAAANNKSGDPVLLAQLKRGLPAQDFDRVAGAVLSEMGKNQSGEFSLAMFSKSWSQLGERQKNILFEKRKPLYDDIAQLSSYLKGVDQFKNTSNTGRSNALAAMVGALGAGVGGAVAAGSVLPLAGAAATVAGGYALAKALARPAGVAAVARMSRAMQNYSNAPSMANRATLTIAARDAGKTLDSLGSSGAELLRHLQGPIKTAADPEQPEVQRVPSQ